MEQLAELVAAVTIAHTVHALAEVTNVRTKLQRVIDAKAGKTLKPYPIDINTRAKAYGIGLSLPIFITLVAYGVLAWLSPSVGTLLWMTVILLAIVELFSMVSLDKYHIDIEPVIRSFNRGQKGAGKSS